MDANNNNIHGTRGGAKKVNWLYLLPGFIKKITKYINVVTIPYLKGKSHVDMYIK